MILAGDIGGTNTRLAVYKTEGKRLNPLVTETFASSLYRNLESIVKQFIDAHTLEVRCACFGVAGPVKEGNAKTSNLEWEIDERVLVHALELKTVKLINDLEANAHGIGELESDDLCLLNKGVPDKKGCAALIAAGTGLGEAGLFRNGSRYRPFPSEGGHTDFAPRNEVEIELLHYLLKQYDHVSYEHVLSGPGLYNIYKFLLDSGRGSEPAWLKEQFINNDPSGVISQTALQGKSELCVQALDLFVSIYGSEAGNAALKFMATGGLYIGGGIAPKIIDKLKDGRFMKAFVNKGRMRPLLESIPVYVIVNDQTALLGAASVARDTIVCKR